MIWFGTHWLERRILRLCWKMNCTSIDCLVSHFEPSTTCWRKRWPKSSPKSDSSTKDSTAWVVSYKGQYYPVPCHVSSGVLISHSFGGPYFAFLRGNPVQESLISSAIFSFLILFRYVFHFYENILYLFTLFRTCVSFEGFFLVSLDLTESILSEHFFRTLCGLVLVIIYGFFNTKRILLWMSIGTFFCGDFFIKKSSGFFLWSKSGIPLWMFFFFFV